MTFREWFEKNEDTKSTWSEWDIMLAERAWEAGYEQRRFEEFGNNACSGSTVDWK